MIITQQNDSIDALHNDSKGNVYRVRRLVYHSITHSFPSTNLDLASTLSVFDTERERDRERDESMQRSKALKELLIDEVDRSSDEGENRVSRKFLFRVSKL